MLALEAILNKSVKYSHENGQNEPILIFSEGNPLYLTFTEITIQLAILSPPCSTKK
jgi:hypothetical protein